MAAPCQELVIFHLNVRSRSLLAPPAHDSAHSAKHQETEVSADGQHAGLWSQPCRPPRPLAALAHLLPPHPCPAGTPAAWNREAAPPTPPPPPPPSAAVTPRKQSWLHAPGYRFSARGQPGQEEAAGTGATVPHPAPPSLVPAGSRVRIASCHIHQTQALV